MLRPEDIGIGRRIRWDSPDHPEWPPAFGTIVGIINPDGVCEVLVEWDDTEDTDIFVYVDDAAISPMGE